MMTLDTNILVYSVDSRDLHKHNVALKIMQFTKATTRSILTLQSISEFYHVVTRKSYMSLQDAEIIAKELIGSFSIANASSSTLNRAIELYSKSANKIQFWDAMLLATAKEHGVNLMVSEDLADGSIIGGIEIYNPFNKKDFEVKLSKYSTL